MLQIKFLLLTLTFLTSIRSQCNNGEIFDLILSKCLSCSLGCQNCYNIYQDQCINCSENFFKSNLNISACTQSCSVGEILTQNQQCIKCQVEGCIKCNSEQQCLECNENLSLDQEKNLCFLKEKVCQSNLDFIQQPFSQKQCVKSCSNNFYQNQNTQICEKMHQCIQINSSFTQFNQRVTEIRQFQQEYYIIRANQCQFVLADQNFQLVYLYVLQQMQDFEDQYMDQGSEIKQKSFMIDVYGGCLANKTLTVVLTLQEDRQIQFSDQLFDFEEYGYILQVIQKNQNIIFIFHQDNQIKIKNLVIQNNTKFQKKIINQFTFIDKVYYSKSLNSIIKKDEKSQNVIISILNSSQDQVDSELNITFSDKFNSFEIYENQQDNSTFAFLLSNQQLQFINLTDYKLKNKEVLKGAFVQIIKTGFITELSKIQNIFFTKNNTIEIFLSYIINKNSYYYDQIRILFNTKSQTFLVNYLNPNEFQKQYYTYTSNFLLEITLQQLMFSKNKETDTNSFYIFDQNQVSAQKGIATQRINFSIENLQYSHKIITRFSPFQMKHNLTSYDMVQIINNRYLLMSQNFVSYIQDYIVDIIQQKQIITYQYKPYYLMGKFRYIQKRKLLVVTNVPQIFSLDTGEPLINNPQDYYFSLLNYIILNEDQLVYSTRNDNYEGIIYLIDFSTFKISELYNFGLFNYFIFVTSSENTPLIAFNDIIYVYNYNNDCQPFSISLKSLVYQLVNISFLMYESNKLIYQKTGEIFLFYESLIEIYSFDLSNRELLNFGINYPENFFGSPSKIQSDRYIFFYDQIYFYRFDLELKQFSIIKARSEQNQYRIGLIDFYYLDQQQKYIKKSDSIIDTDSMVIIKSSVENCLFLGSVVSEEGIQIHSFLSNNQVFWEQNLFNDPFNVFNLTQDQIIQQVNLENNKLAIFDQSTKAFFILDALKSNQSSIQIKFDISFNLSITVIDWDLPSFFWVKDSCLYLLDSKISLFPEIITELDSNIVKYQYCPIQQIIVAQTSQNKIYSIDTKKKENVDFSNPFQVEPSYYVQCEDNFIIIYFPKILIFDLVKASQTNAFSKNFVRKVIFPITVLTQKPKIFLNTLNPNQFLLINLNQQFPPILYLLFLSQIQLYNIEIFQNTLKVKPIIKRKNSLLIVFYNQNQNLFSLDNFTNWKYLFDYRYNNTNLFYDDEHQILIGLTGALKQINIINIPGDQKLIMRETNGYFAKNAVYFYQEQTTIIIADDNAIMYVSNYLTQTFNTFYIQAKDIQGILMDKNKNTLFLYSKQFIYTHEFPSMEFIETISLQGFNETSIIQVYLDTQKSLMNVLTQTHLVTFDLTEIVYATQTNLLQYQKVQCLNLGQEFIVCYSIVNLSLNLYQNSQLQDSLLLEPSLYNMYPYFTQLVLIQGSQLFFIQFEWLNIVYVDLNQKKFILKQRVQLIGLPDNYFYDQISNSIYIFYQQNYQLTFVDLNREILIEIFLTNFNEGDIYNSLICSQYIILPSLNRLQVYDIMQQQIYLIHFSSNNRIKFVFKLQVKSFLSNLNNQNLWEIPFDFEDRFNNNDSGDDSQKLICVIAQEGKNILINIINLKAKQNLYSYLLNQSFKIVNIVSDPFRKLIYLVNNLGFTSVFSYSLKPIIDIQNACLKQAKISFDSNFIYSICPNDIIIYNGRNLQQQFPIINQGLREVDNFINTNHNNYFIVMSKNALSLIKLELDSSFQILYETKHNFQQLLNMNVKSNENSETYLEFLLSSYENIQHLIIPLQQNKNCYINIQQQNRSIENIYTDINLLQNLQQLKDSNKQLSLIEMEFQDQQEIKQLNFTQVNVNQQNNDTNQYISLVYSTISKQNNIHLSFSGNLSYPSEIKHIYFKNMNLSIKNSLVFNQNKEMKNFQMFNLTLNIQKSIQLTDFERVFIQNISFKNVTDSQNIIIIQNCGFVLIEQIEINDLSSTNIQFILINNIRVIIQQVRVSKIKNQTLFKINNNNEVRISEITINDSLNIELFTSSFINNLIISNVVVKSVQLSQILNTKGSTNIDIQNITIDDSQYLKLVQLQPIKLENKLYFSKSFIFQNLKLSNSVDIQIDIQSDQVLISDINAYNLSLSHDFLSLSAIKLLIQSIHVENSFSLLNQPSLLYIQKYDQCSLVNINTSNSQLTAFRVFQQELKGVILIKSCKFLDFKLKSPLLLFISVSELILEDIQIQNVLLSENIYSSSVQISQCYQVTISESQFINNTNTNGIGGSIYATDNEIIQIKDTIFKLNQCVQQNGGALSIKNNVKVGDLFIDNSQFLNNKATKSTGGAIHLENSNMIMTNSIIQQNEAQIGGGIYYEQVIPDFILQLNQKENNTITQNVARIYGNNLGSTLRSIRIDMGGIKTSRDSSIIKQLNNMIQIQQFKSGDQIYFNKIQLLDEEDNPLQILGSNSNQLDSNQYSSNVLSIMQKISISLNWDQQSQQIQCIGEISSKLLTNNSFKLQAQIIYKPNSEMTLSVISNTFAKLLDSKGNIYLSQGYLQENMSIFFESCSLGQIIKQQSNSIICEDCPEGKYSLSLSDNQCQQCPESAVKCYQSTIQLKNGYWRENEQTDKIIYCFWNPDNCQAESSKSKQYCAVGYKGPLCYSCDTYGEIWGQRYQQIFGKGDCQSCEENWMIIVIHNLILFLIIFLYIFILLKSIINRQQAKLAGYYITKMEMLYLGSTLIRQDKSQILSKMLTDHLQILSLLNLFSINTSRYLVFPIQVSGNSLSLTNKSIDCFFSNYPNLQPLWFYQSLWSLSLPILIIFFYLIIGILLKILKNNKNILNYMSTSLIFIYFYFFPMVVMLLSRSLNCLQIGGKNYMDLDINILCYDSQYHQPYIFFFFIPLLMIWTLVIPLYLFLKIRKGKTKKWGLFIEIKYSFIFAGYKDKFYYWEFGKLIYKSIIILISTLFQQSNNLKVCMQYAAILFKIYVVFKIQPYQIQTFNYLLQKSAIICAFSLILSQIIATDANMNTILFLMTISLLILSNLFYIIQLVCGICLITISSYSNNNSRFQNCLLYFIKKYPSFFERMQIQKHQIKISSLFKIKHVKIKIRQLVQYFRSNQFFTTDSVQQHFSLQRTITGSPKQEITNSSSRFYLKSQMSQTPISNQTKKTNSFKNMREKWSYYSRKTKDSPLNQQFQELAITRNMQNFTQNEECTTQISAEDNFNKQIKLLINQNK